MKQGITARLAKIHSISKEIDMLGDRYLEYLHEDSPTIDRQTSLPAVNILPFCAALIKIAEGWHYYVEERGDATDVMIVFAEKDYPLPDHVHFQVETIHVEQGSLKITMQEEGKEIEHELQAGENIRIGSYIPHSAIADKESARLRITFQPPITQPMYRVGQ